MEIGALSDRVTRTIRSPFSNGSVGRIAPSMTLNISAQSPMPTESVVTTMMLAAVVCADGEGRGEGR